jgi:lipopolysaccharide biosynthesis glycosyltransferase
MSPVRSGTTTGTVTGAPVVAATAAPTVTATAAPASTKRRIAFASYVDEVYLPGFLTLLRSLALTNPTLCLDYVVLYDDLTPASVSAIHRLHPHIRFRRVDASHYDAFVKGDRTNYLVRKAYFSLDAFRIRDYDTIVVLDTDMVVLGDISPLLDVREGIGAVEQFFYNDSGAKLNSGLLVLNAEVLNDEFVARIDRTGVSGEYELDKHDQGILNAILEGGFVRLDQRYNYVKRRLSGDLDVPPEVAVLHFTGQHKPWTGGEVGYDKAQARWEAYDLPEDDFFRAYLDQSKRHPDLVVHYGRELLERGLGGVNVAIAVAESLYEAGHFREAAEVCLRWRPAADLLHPRYHWVLGQSLVATSKYEDAVPHLVVASRSPSHAVDAFRALADLAWVLRDYDATIAHATGALRLNPVDRRCRILLRRGRAYAAAAAADTRGGGAATGDQLAHVAFYMDAQGNAGDKVLPESVRLCFRKDASDTSWRPIHVHQQFDADRLAEINSRQGLVVGGGGLFIPDTAPNGNSCWQWNVTDRALKGITVPIAIFGVGYNTFEGQSYADTRFRESLALLVERSSFVGLRNNGSIERVRDSLPAELRDRVTYQPCPTTVTRHLVDGWQDPVTRDDTVLINAAYDRFERRFGREYGRFLERMATAITAMRERADVRYAAHAVTDEKFVYDLRREHGVALPVIPLYEYTNEEIWKAYARTRLVVGMRGHAGMIPFGVGTPILSLISHPKLGFFLKDLDRPEWGISVHDQHLAHVLPRRVGEILDDHAAVTADVLQLQEKLWSITRRNLAALAPEFGTVI